MLAKKFLRWVPGATAPMYRYTPFEHILQLLPSDEQLISPELHPPDTAEVVGDVAAAWAVLLVFWPVPLLVVWTVVAGLELLEHTMAPFRHFVPDETAPMLTYKPLTQTDQLSPSEGHWIAPVVHSVLTAEMPTVELDVLWLEDVEVKA